MKAYCYLKVYNMVKNQIIYALVFLPNIIEINSIK